MGIKKLIILALLLLWVSSLQAANLLWSENFDDQDITDVDSQPSVGEIWARDVGLGYYNVSPPVYQYNAGRGGSGYCFASGTGHDSFLEWHYATTWPTNEMYVSFWIRYPTYTDDAVGHWNIKTFYPHWDGTASYVGYFSTGYQTNQAFFHAVRSPTYYKTSMYPLSPNAWDKNWHKYEFYVNFASGNYKYWFDGVQMHDYNWGDIWTTPVAMNYITFGGEDSSGVNAWTREIDDIEVWDGMPDSEGTAPTANFSQDKTTCDAPCTVTFTDASTDSPTSWDWDWGDGTAHGTTQNPTHQYTAEGTYTPTLTASNAYGGTTHTGDTISITVVPAPVADFMYAVDPDDEDYVAPVTALFTDTSTNSPTSWAWDFDNDGDTDSTEQNPSYEYTEAGTYTVKLTATNAAGSDSETKSDIITVTAAPAPPTLSFYLTNPSGSGAAQGSPHNSLGGYRSTSQVSASAMKNLFDDVTVAESIVGDTEYRFLDVYNSGDSSATKVQVFVSSDTSSSGTEITLGYNSTNQPHEDSWNGEAVANEDTAPASPSLTFGTYTRASPLHLGTIPAGRSVRICVKRTVTAGVPWTARDVGTIAVRYLGD